MKILQCSSLLQFILQLLGEDEFLPSSKFIQWIAGELCNPPFEFLCDDFLMLIMGYDKDNMNSVE